MHHPHGPDAYTLVRLHAATHHCPLSVAEAEVIREARHAQETDMGHWEYWREIELALIPNDHPKPTEEHP